MKRNGYDIEIHNLTYAYPDGTPALAGISTVIQSGESVAILGPNGAGKSTLLLALSGLVLGTGRITISGIELSKKTVRAVRRKVGIVFQNPDDQLFCPTVYDDVAFGPRNMGLPDVEVQERVENALAAMGIAGYEKRSAHHLSYGERKRASIATILSMDPDIVAFDEPAATLDPEGVYELKKVISKIEKTKLIVTHDISLASDLADRGIVIHHGKILEDLPMKQLLKDKKRLRQLKLLYE
jgi:cobalt transport protein ATP-binding subunit